MKKLKKGSKIRTNDGRSYNDNDNERGVEINGLLIKLDFSHIDLEEFTNDFIDFVESKGMSFGGEVNYKNPCE